MPRTGFELGALFACRYTGDAGDQEHCDGFLLNSYAQDRLRAWSMVRLSLHRRRRRPGAMRWFSPHFYAQDRLRAWSIVRLSLHRRRRRPGAFDGFLLNSYAQDGLRAWSIVRLSLHRRRRRPGALRWFSPELLCPGPASNLEHCSLVVTQEMQETRSTAMVFS